MGSIGRYIVRTTFGAFLMTVVSLTTLVWITHALREIDIVTNQGQTVLAFLGITGLLIPYLTLVVAPLSLVVAVAYTLYKLNTDSELVVMNAAGMSPWRVFFPFFTVALIVAVLVGLTSAYIAPKCLRELRLQLTQVRADLIANIIQPGRFTSVDGQRLTFHVRERRANGELVGIFIDDRRTPNERATFLAERGQLLENETGTFLVLEQGSAQRLEAAQRDPAIVQFDRYAFDLTAFTGSDATPTFNVKERYLWDLAWPDLKDPYIKANAARVWSELNDRIAAPIFPLVFGIIAFAILGAPRTNRQSRVLSILLMVGVVALVRVVGFVSVVASVRQPHMVVVVYGALAAVSAVGLVMIGRGTIIETPAAVLNLLGVLQERFARTPTGVTRATA
ncbi:MAG TPA: LPS export ABC transporter permease LptF [Xanthobacteraceae bacterium]|nr:LPS export ABC transporter permease LptF [Xanthobacteraceae bacterium]